MASDRGGDGGWRRRRRRVRGHPIPTDSVDAHIGVGYGEGHSFSSDYDLKDSDTSGRNKVLEDAFFGFFKKQAVRSLKRKFADACNDIPELAEVKKSKGDGVGCSVFTRFGPKYFIEVLKNLTSDQRAVVENFGFGCLLLFDCGYIPSSFARWVADRIDPLCSHITVCGKPFIISNETFHIVLGLPIGGMQIHLNSDDGRNFILSHFQLSDIPHITFFGNKLSGPDILSELDVFICFITVALSCLLCPVVSHSVNFSCLAMLKDPASVKSYDFSRLVYEHCMNSLIEYSSFGKSRGRRMKLPVCCNYVLVVRYLDFLDFGIQNVDQATPRVNVWKGNMIRLYSGFDFKSRHVFGKKQLKGYFACGHLQGFDALMKSIIPFKLSPLSSDFKIGVHSQFAKSLQAEMRCEVCGWPDGPCQKKRRESSFLFIYLGKSFLRSMSPEREEYVFQLVNEHNKTRICRPGYLKLLKDYDMKRGDRFRIDLDHPPPFFPIFPAEGVGVPKQRVLEPHVFVGNATAVVFSRGLQLTAGQTARMNAFVNARGLGVGAVFVHPNYLRYCSQWIAHPKEDCLEYP